MSGFAIIQRARTGQRMGIAWLALVDRSKCKRQWWTSDTIGLAIRYESRSAADFAARRLRRNDAQVVPFAEAKRLINQQDADIMFDRAMSDAEMGWDGHKESW